MEEEILRTVEKVVEQFGEQYQFTKAIQHDLLNLLKPIVEDREKLARSLIELVEADEKMTSLVYYGIDNTSEVDQASADFGNAVNKAIRLLRSMGYTVSAPSFDEQQEFHNVK